MVEKKFIKGQNKVVFSLKAKEIKRILSFSLLKVGV